jgi:hypothetical protein
VLARRRVSRSAVWPRRLLLARHHPEDILAGVVEKEPRILTIVEEMRDLVTAEGE